MATNSITDTLNKNIIAIARRCFSGELSSGEAAHQIKRARRLAQAEALRVPVVAVTDADLVTAQIAEPPQASRPLTLRDRIERRVRGHYEEW
jgi:hypothetical protein